MITYFAYGSNLCFRRFQSRAPSATTHATGVLRGFQLRWHKRSQADGSAKCSIRRTEDSHDLVYGVLYSIRPADELSLDRAEGLGYGYAKSHVNVDTEDGPVQAMTYIAELSHIDDTLRPLSWYRDLVVAGARDAGLPEDYVHRLALTEADPDPDASRDALNRTAIPCSQSD